ncbi:Acyltransferase [Leishmania donovani]|uniref:Acyltransferase_-_putative n=3 Tax=Leishmania donovani species complex TaxID=38574 RepID=A0A6L0XKE8_LEIIN|nr:conserved hypothetical protein [Leishmania infantum JPCM5]TPP50669.1 Acyltransferase family protein [Leishmania donovani]CAC9510094.1 Acyltransferase_-_putative [Leishmania infantum]CAJ1990721.1 Acyltransferase [Leishmania donovani]CAM69808.1 conserved hypothetical protein [Leishmania infantum JPCM5]SUZ43751.1 Acyltransferase_-_putative [Leishmania infantum]|eukprot:XP_001466761.1 conserved hypothetical protein [Leishmania infantum JPCM5]
MSLLSWIIFAALYGGFLCLLRERKVPLIVMRAWYTFHLVLCVIISWLCGVALSLLKKVHLLDTETSQSLTRCVCATTFGYWLRFNSPHIRVEHLPGSLSFSSITEQHNMCLCHSSFFDTILFLWYVPYRYIYKVKTFFKASLRKLPLFGTVIVMCGHFPVYFSSTDADSFSVHKDKQAAVAADVENWVKKGKSLCFYPEGMVNRTPEVLKDFRLGSFKTILAHQMPLYYCVSYGNHEVWPPSLKGLPGYPADVYVYIGKYQYPADKVDALELATGLREEMQKHMDEMLALREKRGHKPWWKRPTAKA